VLTSAQAAAQLLGEALPVGARVLVVGADALRAEVEAVGLKPVTSADGAAAVVQGYAPTVSWTELAEACVAVRAGARWVATNTDRTLPSPRGALPGNGALVAALATALGRQPDTVVGKPAPELFRVAVSRHGATAPLVVGDRLDTDIEGAVNAGMPSLLVLTGVTTPLELLRAAPNHRPTYVATDLNGLSMQDDAVRVPPLDPETKDGRAGGWRVTSDGGRLQLTGGGETVDALRALASAAWVHTGWTSIVADPAVAASLGLSEQLA
jgi:ribonucleotide monophosphatase NagD (HAD superfamily)